MRLRFYERARDCQAFFEATGLYRAEGDHASALTGAATELSGNHGSTMDGRNAHALFQTD